MCYTLKVILLGCAFISLVNFGSSVLAQCPPSYTLPIFMERVGDVNNDGFDDLTFFGPDTMVYVISGENLDTLYTIDGTSQGPQWGTRGTRYAGDVNNDGYDDLLIPQ